MRSDRLDTHSDWSCELQRATAYTSPRNVAVGEDVGCATVVMPCKLQQACASGTQTDSRYLRRGKSDCNQLGAGGCVLLKQSKQSKQSHQAMQINAGTASQSSATQSRSMQQHNSKHIKQRDPALGATTTSALQLRRYDHDSATEAKPPAHNNKWM